MGAKVFELAADLMNPLHRLALGREQQAGAVVDDDLDSAVVMLDAQLVVLDWLAFGSTWANRAAPTEPNRRCQPVGCSA